MTLHKGIELKVTYRSDMSGLKSDLKEIERHRHGLQKKPILIPVRLDMQQVRRDAAQAAKVIQEQLAKMAQGAGAGNAVSKGGIIGPSGTIADYEKYGRQATGIIRTVTKEWQNSQKQIISTTRTIAKGLKETTTQTTSSKGKASPTVTTTTDERNLEKFRDELQGIEKKYGRQLGSAIGTKDKLKELDLLTNKAEELRTTLHNASRSGFGDSRDFRKAEQSIDRISQRIANLSGDTARSSQSRSFEQIDKAAQRRLQARLKENQQQQQIAKSIPEQAEREAKLNALLRQREDILRRHQLLFNRLDAAAQRRGRPELADRAHNRVLGIQNQINQHRLDQTRATSKAEIQARKTALKEELAAAQRKARHDLEQNKTLQNRAKLLYGARKAHQHINHLIQQRQAIYNNLNHRLAAIEGRATTQGFGTIATSARNARADFARRAIPDLERHAAAHRKSGHAIDFHSGSLLKNAATFARWSLAMKLVTAPLAAFNAGVQGMVEVDRQFATLRAVFRGTDEEAQRLKQDVIELGAAQGQTAQTSMDAAIRWSRLGLTRVQVLQAVQTSLVAANVAEISAAEAAEKLAAIYATYNLNLSDVATTLDRLNAISNRYNVTNKDLLEGIVRVAAVAKQAKLAQRDLEGVIGAVTGATGRPGQEVGNTLKFVLQRIRRPETLRKLKDELNIDLTGPNGQIKEASLLLSELAAIYPTLSRNQQAMLLDLTAGSRQAARFALVLTEWRQGQILATEAAFDTGSAMRENQKILESLEARINSLKTAWTDLWVAIGDTGVLSLLAGTITNVADFTKTLSKLTKEISKPDNENTQSSDKIKLTSTEARSPFGPQMLFGHTVTKQEIEDKIKYLKDVLESRDGGLNLDARFATSSAELQKEIDALQAHLDDNYLQKYSNSIADIGKEINDLREKVTALEKGTQVFHSLADAVETGAEPTRKLLRDWRNASNLLTNLENGGKIFAENFGKVDKLISQGHSRQAAETIRNLGNQFEAQQPAAREEFLQRQTKLSHQLHRAYDDLTKQSALIAKGFDGLSGDALQNQRQKFKEINDELKTARQQIQAVDADLHQLADADGLDPNQIATITRYFEKARNAVRQMADTLSSLSIQGADNPDRAYLRRTEAMDIEIQNLRATRTKTLAQQTGATTDAQTLERLALDFGWSKTRQTSKIKYAPHFSTRNAGEILFKENFPANLKKLEAIAGKKFGPDTTVGELNQYARELVKTKQEEARIAQDGIDLIDQQIERRQRELDIEKEKLQIERQAARLKEAFDQGAQDASINARQSLIGPNESAKLISQSRTITNSFRTGIPVDDTSATDILNKRAFLLQNEATITQNIISLRQRDADITASLANSQYKIQEALRKQTEETSKRLALASREDQLRAAMAARAIRQDGPLSLQEFSFLSQATRSNINTFHRDSVSGLGDVRETQAKEDAALREEQKLIRRNINGISTSLADLRKYIDIFTKANPVTAENTGLKGRPLQNLFGEKHPPQIHINTGDINIEVGKQFQTLTRELILTVKQELSNEIDSIRHTVNEMRPSQTTSAATAHIN